MQCFNARTQCLCSARCPMCPHITRIPKREPFTAAASAPSSLQPADVRLLNAERALLDHRAPRVMHTLVVTRCRGGCICVSAISSSQCSACHLHPAAPCGGTTVPLLCLLSSTSPGHRAHHGFSLESLHHVAVCPSRGAAAGGGAAVQVVPCQRPQVRQHLADR